MLQSIRARIDRVGSTNVRLHPSPADLPLVTKPTFYEIVQASKIFLDRRPRQISLARIVSI